MIINPLVIINDNFLEESHIAALQSLWIEYNKVHWLGDELLLELIPLTKELMSITRKWRSKALMRASKIEELTTDEY